MKDQKFHLLLPSVCYFQLFIKHVVGHATSLPPKTKKQTNKLKKKKKENVVCNRFANLSVSSHMEGRTTDSRTASS